MYGPTTVVPFPCPVPSFVPNSDTFETMTPVTSAPVLGSIAAHSTMYPSGKSMIGGMGAMSGAGTRPRKRE